MYIDEIFSSLTNVNLSDNDCVRNQSCLVSSKEGSKVEKQNDLCSRLINRVSTLSPKINMTMDS